MEPDDANLNLVQKIFRSMSSRVENGHVLSLDRQKHRNLDFLLKGKEPLNIKIPSKSLPRKDSDKENSSDRLSYSPNPFVSQTFELSFEVTHWLDLDMDGPSFPTIHRHGPYPILRIGVVEHIKYPRRTYLHVDTDSHADTDSDADTDSHADTNSRIDTDSHVDLHRLNLTRQPIIVVEPLPLPPASRLRVKIPWKGKFIVVKLPPVNAA